MTDVYRASCSCDALAVDFNQPPKRISGCACDACKRRTGSVLAVQCTFNRHSAQFYGSPIRYQRKAPSGSLVDFYFCGDCGATVWYEHPGIDGVVVPIGVISPAIQTPPSSIIFAERCPSWISFDEDLLLD
ncbi:MAG: GFA family protein [Gammaproteobacteria bacterium]|nr:GFA family protein [Gammaproteobacteria bacterium]